MKDLNYKTIRIITAFGTVFCMMFSMLVTPFAAAREVKIFNRATRIQPGVNPAESESRTKQMILGDFGNLPLSFEQNSGQTAESVKFLARSPGYTMFFTGTGAVIKTRGKSGEKMSESVLQMQFDGARKSPRIEGVAMQSHKTNYLKGEKKNWKRGISNYEKIVYRELYKGIDTVFYGVQSEVEYDFIVSPRAAANQIKLAFKNAGSLMLDENGALHIKTGETEIVQPAPFVYQEIDGEKKQIAGKFAVDAAGMTVGFEIGEYDRNQTLVIDPKLVYSSYFGGNNISTSSPGDEIVGIAVDSNGNTFVAGNTTSTDFLTTSGAFQDRLRQGEVCDNSSFISCGDAFVAKINPAGNELVYSTLIGGQLNDRANDLALGSDGLPVIVGATDPRIFPICGLTSFVAAPYPTTDSNFQAVPGNFVGGCLRSTLDAFVTKLNSAGTDLIYSTFYAGRGDEEAIAVAIDSANKIYVTGNTVSPNLPTKNGFQNNLADGAAGSGDLFIAKFDPNQSGNASFLYGSYLGGAAREIATDIAVDAAKNAYLVGGTTSTDIIAKSPSNLLPLQSNNGGISDGIIAKIDPTNTTGENSLVYLTYFGGTGQDQIDAVKVEPTTQRAYVLGNSNSNSGFPLFNAFDSITDSARDAFVAKLNADGTALFYSTFLGGSGSDFGDDIAVDVAGNAYVTGSTRSNDFPTVNAFQTSNQGGNEAFVAKIRAVPNTSTAPQILWSSFYGGSGEDNVSALALDKEGQVYLAGSTTSPNLPVSAVNLKSGGSLSAANSDGFIAKIQGTFNDSVGIYDSFAGQFRLRNPLSTGAANTTVGFGQTGDLPVVGDWNGDGQTEIGVYDTIAAQFTLRRKICPLFTGCIFAAVTFNFGQFGDLPVAGDWNADGIDTIGVYRPSTGQFFLADSLSNPVVTHTVNFTAPGNIVPLAGDWDGDGTDTVGVYVLAEIGHTVGQFRLTNQDAANPAVNIAANLGNSSERPVVGDWDGDGDDTVGLLRPSTGNVRLTNNNASFAINFILNETGTLPIVGDWDTVPNL